MFLLLLIAQLHAATVEEIANHPQWLRLMHWNSSQNSSRIDAPFFFLAEDGKRNLKNELIATIKAFENKTWPEGEPWPLACSYPARYQFLVEQGIKLPKYDCSEYEWWRKNLDTKSVTMVFTSFYAGNPASIFGHTFLKLNSDPDHRTKLTDYAVTFAAHATDQMGFIYAMKGLFGGYFGFFALDPYYMKINEYVHSENRDLWEYPLTMNQYEIDRLLAHLWELLKRSSFEYWFLDENCSYQLLGLLDVAFGDSKLAQETTLVVLPTETIKILNRYKKYGKNTIRPSYQKQVEYRYNLLSEDEKKIIKKNDTSTSNVKILDAMIALKRYEEIKHSDDKVKHDAKKAELFELLKLRSKIKTKSELPPDSWLEGMQDENPLLSHAPRKFQIGWNKQDKADGIKFGSQFGLHALTDQQTGMPWHSEIIFGAFDFLLTENSLKFYDITILRLISQTLTSYTSNAWSWRVFLGATRILGTPNKLTPTLQAAMGKTISPINKLSVYSMLGAQSEFHHSLSKGFDIGPTIEIGSFYGGDRLRVHLNSLMFWPVESEAQRISGKIKLQGQFNIANELSLAHEHIFKSVYSQYKNSQETSLMYIHHF